MGNLDSIFTMYAEPVLAELDRFDMSDFHLLMGCGTIDMVNPSLTVLGLVASGNRYEADILVLELSPFVQSTMVAGKAVLGDLPSFWSGSPATVRLDRVSPLSFVVALADDAAAGDGRETVPPVLSITKRRPSASRVGEGISKRSVQAYAKGTSGAAECLQNP